MPAVPPAPAAEPGQPRAAVAINATKETHPPRLRIITPPHSLSRGIRRPGTDKSREGRSIVARPMASTGKTSIFSGIQPTGRKHLGNYIGAIRQYVEGQDRADPAIYCIVDLHAITVEYDPAELRERLYDTTALLLAAGLDPARCILFRQSDVREHTELTWLLSAVTAHGDLN